jgi:hypothetical protein
MGDYYLIECKGLIKESRIKRNKKPQYATWRIGTFYEKLLLEVTK